MLFLERCCAEPVLFVLMSLVWGGAVLCPTSLNLPGNQPMAGFINARDLGNSDPMRLYTVSHLIINLTLLCSGIGFNYRGVH